MSALASRRCSPAVGEPLAGAELTCLLAEVPSWDATNGTLIKQFTSTTARA